MTALPEGWESRTLNELCLPITKADPAEIGRTTIKYIDIGSVDGATHSLIDVPKIDAVGAPSRCRQIVKGGDTVFSTVRPYLEKIAFIDDALDNQFASTGFAVLRPGPDLLSKYLYYYSISHGMLDQVLPFQKGVSYPAVLDKEVRAAVLPVPPLAEQHRIVELLEDHLSRLDAATAYLDAAHRRAENLRWAAVTDALAHVGGEDVRLGDIAEIKNGIFVSRPGSEPNGVPILRIGAVRPLSLDLGDLRYSERSEEDLLEANGLVLPGDLLFTRYNGNPRFVGACAVVPADAPSLTYPDKLIRARVTDGSILPDFVALACSVGEGRAQIQAAVRTTAGQAGISGRDLKAVVIRVPDLGVQGLAVRTAADAADSARQLLSEVERTQRRSDSLRRSLLDAAFSGRLTRSELEPAAA